MTSLEKQTGSGRSFLASNGTYFLFCPICPCVSHPSIRFLSLPTAESVQCIMERSIARRGCVTTSVCVNVCMHVCVCLRPVVMETCCRVSAPAAGGAVLLRGNLFQSVGFLAGVHGFHVGRAGVSLDGVKDGCQLLIGRDLRLELGHEWRLLRLGDGKQRDDSSHRRPLQLVLLLKLLLDRVRLHLWRRGRRSHQVGSATHPAQQSTDKRGHTSSLELQHWSI